MTPEIVFPMGLGGNHVRWLLSIDPKFDLKCCYSNKLENKVNWVCDNVYAKRTWNTWLIKEWHYRNQLDSVINIGHLIPPDSINDFGWQNKKQLILQANDYTLAGYHYFMVNLGLNNLTLDLALAQFKDWESTVEKIKRCKFSSKTILTSDCILEPKLNLEWYQQIVNWAGYTDLYEHASRIHSLYYQCRQQAAKDFVTYFESVEFQTHLDFYKTTYITA